MPTISMMMYDYFEVALRFPYMYLNGVGGWTEFRSFNSLYLLKSCTFSGCGKMGAVLGIVAL